MDNEPIVEAQPVQSSTTVDTTEHSSHFFIVLGSLVTIIFVFMIAALFISQKTYKQSNTTNNTTETITAVPTRLTNGGSLNLQDKGFTHSVGGTVPIDVFANSQGHVISGYDVIVQYDPKIIEFDQISNSDSHFSVVINKSVVGKVILTGIKKLNFPAAILNQNIVTLNFKGISAGTAKMTVEYVPAGKTDSNLVDDKNTDVLARVEGVTITIH